MKHPRYFSSGYKISVWIISFVTASFILFFLPLELAANQYRTAVTGNWTVAGTWLKISGIDADGIPDANDKVTIVRRFTDTLNFKSFEFGNTR